MYFEMLFSEGTNVVSQLSLKYGSDNRVTAVQQGEGADAADWYTFSFDGDKVSALNKMANPVSGHSPGCSTAEK